MKSIYEILRRATTSMNTNNRLSRFQTKLDKSIRDYSDDNYSKFASNQIAKHTIGTTPSRVPLLGDMMFPSKAHAEGTFPKRIQRSMDDYKKSRSR